MDIGQIDMGGESASEGDIHPDLVAVCGNLSASNRLLTCVKPAHHSTSKSTSAPAFSSAIVAGPSTVPVSITPIVGVRETASGHYRGRSLEQLHGVFPTCESPSHYCDSESGEEELVEELEDEDEDDEDEDGPIAHLARLTKSLRG